MVELSEKASQFAKRYGSFSEDLGRLVLALSEDYGFVRPRVEVRGISCTCGGADCDVGESVFVVVNFKPEFRA